MSSMCFLQQLSPFIHLTIAQTHFIKKYHIIASLNLRRVRYSYHRQKHSYPVTAKNTQILSHSLN